MSKNAKITIQNLTKVFYKKQGSVTALDNLNLTIGDGEFVCLLGPSGCGKTTLLRILAGLETTSTGEFSIETESKERPLQSKVFFHLMQFDGSVEDTTLQYIIRDFDRETFEARKQLMVNISNELKNEFGEQAVTLEISDQYFNMGEKIQPVMQIVDIIADAFKRLDIKPNIVPIRGGTDGSQLSYMGLPTPNIFTGGENYHSKYEYISADNMAKATNVIIEAVKIYDERAHE